MALGDDLSHYTAKSVDACLLVLEARLNSEEQRRDSGELFERELIFAIGLRARVKFILEDFRSVDLNDTEEYCDNGASSMEANDMDGRSKRVVRLACSRWHAADLKSAIEDMDLLRGCVMKHLHLSDAELESLSAKRLHERILEL